MIIRNAIQTPDGTILESRSRWDYKSHLDANGKEYMVDGGFDYLRRTVHNDQAELSIRLEDGHELVREAMTWGTYGINGDQPLTQIKLKDMDKEHIQAVLDTCKPLPQFVIAFEEELKYRESI